MAGAENMLAKMNAMPAGKKTAILALLVMTIAGTMLLFSWIEKADYQVLYSNLSEADAGRIVQELRDKKVPYRLEGAGVILVPSSEVYDLRLDLASSGLPQGGSIGFEIFDNTSFTTSEFVQKLNFKRALEGELSKTIRSLTGVDQCRVHLVIPDKSIFAFQEEKPETSAAVFISLAQGRKLNAHEIQGVVHLVSSSVEDLRPESITVVDSKGELLTRPTDDSLMGLSNTQMEYQQSFEKNMISKITSILEPVVGRGKVQAKVSSQFDFTRSERTEETYDPEGVVVRSEQKSTEKTTSGGGTAGIPGTASNLPGGAAGQASSSGGQSQKQDEMINYETSKTIKRVVESPVTLERLTVAILIDGLLPSQEKSVEKPEDYVKRSEDDIRYYEDIVRKTIGFTEDRGDEISVTVMPFTKIETGEIIEAKSNYMPLVFTVLKYFVPLVVALLVIFFVIRPLINVITKAPAAPVAAQGVEVGVGVGVGAGGTPAAELTSKSDVVEWAGENPQEAAGVVREWLEEH